MIFAKNREDLVAATKALDRVLLWNHYVVPQWTYGKMRTARWDRFGRPDKLPEYGLGVSDDLVVGRGEGGQGGDAPVRSARRRDAPPLGAGALCWARSERQRPRRRKPPKTPNATACRPSAI